jgi:hypothetical protein
MRPSQCGSQRSTDVEGMRGSNGRRTWALGRPTRGRGWGRRRDDGVRCRWRRPTAGRRAAGGSEEVRGRHDLLGEEAGGGESVEGHDTGSGNSGGDRGVHGRGGGSSSRSQGIPRPGRGGSSNGSRGIQRRRQQRRTGSVVGKWIAGTEGEAHGLRGKNEKQRRYAGEGAGSLGKPARAADARGRGRTTYHANGRTKREEYLCSF